MSVKPSPQGSHRGSVISYEISPSQNMSGRSSKSLSRNSQRRSPFISSASSSQNSNNKEESMNTDSSMNSLASSRKLNFRKKSGNSNNRDDINSSLSSYDRDRVSPKQSSHSPIKSNKFQKRTVRDQQHQQNILNVTIPTAALLGSVQTTSSFPDSNSEL